MLISSTSSPRHHFVIYTQLLYAFYLTTTSDSASSALCHMLVGDKNPLCRSWWLKFARNKEFQKTLILMQKLADIWFTALLTQTFCCCQLAVWLCDAWCCSYKLLKAYCAVVIDNLWHISQNCFLSVVNTLTHQHLVTASASDSVSLLNLCECACYKCMYNV